MLDVVSLVYRGLLRQWIHPSPLDTAQVSSCYKRVGRAQRTHLEFLSDVLYCDEFALLGHILWVDDFFGFIVIFLHA